MCAEDKDLQQKAKEESEKEKATTRSIEDINDLFVNKNKN
jgi:hypothetical protein